jgi:hypothetical protein
MSITYITPAGALVNAIEVAAKSDQREAARCTTTAPRSPRSGLLASATAQFKRTFTRALKTTEGVGLATEARSRPA